MSLQIPKFSREVATFVDPKFKTWTLYQLQDNPKRSFLWVEFRLQLPSAAPKRKGRPRAYHLAWSPLESRLARGKDRADIERLYPDMLAALERCLALDYPPAWLQEAFTPAEIEAEKALRRELRASWDAKRAERVAAKAARQAAALAEMLS